VEGRLKLLERSRDDDRATALVREHLDVIDESWQRVREVDDLIGLLRVEDDGSLFLGLTERVEKIEQAPELLEYFPQLSRPAWQASPVLAAGTAMWLIVGASPPQWTCMRVHKTVVVSGGSA